jgi:hypothetical protein
VRAQSEVIAPYDRPFPRLRSLLCLAQRGFPLCVGVVPNAAIRKDCVSDFELSIRCAIEASRVPGTIKLLHCGFANRAKEGPGHILSLAAIISENARTTASLCKEDRYARLLRVHRYVSINFTKDLRIHIASERASNFGGTLLWLHFVGNATQVALIFCCNVDLGQKIN